MRPDPEDLAPALRDLGIDPHDVQQASEEVDPAAAALLARVEGAADASLRSVLDRGLTHEGAALLWIESQATAPRIAALRDGLWPLLHVVGIYRFDGGSLTRSSQSGSADLGAPGVPLEGTLVVLRRKSWVQSPSATVEKFDLNAKGWDGEPGGPGYPHFRWMRRYVGLYAPVAEGSRILDFGCGAGWCGIEAARRARGTSLRSFDPSPNMVEITGDNARREGVTDFDGRTGFGEDPPFPAGGEEPFDHVISSGVISFSPDPERWLDGLARTVRPGGTLVVGDINRNSQGFRRRRRNKPLLPVRELNAATLAEVRDGLVRRGFRFESGSHYQLTWPVPQVMHLNETRLRGLLTWPLLWANQLGAASDRLFRGCAGGGFDSWVMHLTRSR